MRGWISLLWSPWSSLCRYFRYLHHLACPAPRSPPHLIPVSREGRQCWLSFLAHFLTLCFYQAHPLTLPAGCQRGSFLFPSSSLCSYLLHNPLKHDIPVFCLRPVSLPCQDFRGSSPAWWPFPSLGCPLDLRKGRVCILRCWDGSPSCQDIAPNTFLCFFFILFPFENSHFKRLKWTSWGLRGLLVLKTSFPVWREGKQLPSFHMTSIHRRL